MKLLVATNNPGKLREYRRVLSELLPEISLLSLAEVGITFDVEESGDTFEENAWLKVEGYGDASGMPVLADDSGLMVDALGGFPGVHSARWSGPTASDRNRALLEKLEGVPPEARGARFVCVALFRTPEGERARGYGEVKGRIGLEERGARGFGYDPLFFLPEYGRTLAELPPEEKNRISHRGRAARAIAPEVARLLRAR